MADLDITAQVIDKTGPGLKRVGSNIDKTANRAGRLGKLAKVAAIGVAGIAAAGIGIGVKLVGDFLRCERRHREDVNHARHGCRDVAAMDLRSGAIWCDAKGSQGV